jgi:Zn-finger nucleic acid-binding protein
MNCPKDGTVMRERERDIGAGSTREIVILDVCPTCGGIFLDSGELEKLTEFERRYDDGGSQRDRRHRRDRRDDDRGGDDDDEGGGGILGRIFGGLGNLGD